jgi:hypothetical protein
MERNMLKKLTATLLVSGLAFVSVPAAEAVVTTSNQQAVVSKSSDYSAKKKTKFWNLIKSYDPLVKSVGKKQTVALGVSTCDLLRAGGDSYDLAEIVLNLDTPEFEDTIMATMAAAVIVLCPEQEYKLD